MRQAVGCMKIIPIISFLAVFLSLGAIRQAGAVTMPINNISVSAIKTDSVVIGWDSTDAGTSVIEYGLTASYGFQTQEDSLSYFHTQTVSGLTEGTLYHYRIRTKDYNGAETVSGDYTFTTRTQAELEAVIRTVRADGGLPKIYYVKTDGDDTTDGFSIATAWQHPSYAVSKADAGDMIYLLDGTWSKEHIYFSRSGIDVAPITLSAYDGPENGKPTLDGVDMLRHGNDTDAINTQANPWTDIRQSYINVRGLKIMRYYGAGGIRGKHNTISDCEISDCGLYNSMFTLSDRWSEYNTIENCTLHDAGWNALQLIGAEPNSSQTSDGPISSNSVKYMTVRNNTIYAVPEHGHIDLFGNFKWVTIEGNKLYDGCCNLIFTHDPPNYVQYMTIKDNDLSGPIWAYFVTGRSFDSLVYRNTFSDPPAVGGIQYDAMYSVPHHIDTIENKFLGSSRMIVYGYDKTGWGNQKPVGFRFIRNSVADSASLELMGAEATYIGNTGKQEIRLGNNNNRATIQYDNNTVFRISITGSYNIDTPIIYTSTRSFSVITGSGNGLITYFTYPMTARPSSDSTTVTVNKFDTSLSKGSVLVDFTADTTNSNNVDFIIGELKADTNYQVTRAGVNYHVIKSNRNKCIVFSNSEWSAKTFTVTETDALADIITPAYAELGSRINHIDLDGNGVINILDIVIVAQHFGESTTCPDACPAPNYDIDSNGSVNILDIRLVAEGM